MVSISDGFKEGNILKLILMVRFACATLDVGNPIFLPHATENVDEFGDVVKFIGNQEVEDVHPSETAMYFWQIGKLSGETNRR
jgi:hypothetical protein